MYAGDRRVISCSAEDLTGDRIPDMVCLTGIREEGSEYWGEIRVEARDGRTGMTAMAALPGGGGYGPRMFLGNFTGMKGLEVLASADTGGSGGTTLDGIYRFQDGKLIQIFDSEEYNQRYAYRVSYQDGYRVLAQSLVNGLDFWIDLYGRGQEYLKQIYQPDGRLTGPREGFVNPLSGLYPVDFDGDGVFELVALQRIAGLYNADGLGYFQNILSWQEGEFVLSGQQVSVFGT